MAKVIDIVKFKKARILKGDLEKILKIVDLSIRALSVYIKYKPIAEVVSVLKSSELVLKGHLKQCNNILDTKDTPQ